MQKQPCLLIVDDEPDNFDVIEALLATEDYQLQYTASGREALSLLETFNPDLILLDVMMPGLDGIEVCRQIKALPKWQAIPIVMVTALSSKTDLAHCLKSGADDFISKPVNGIELRARVHSMLRIKQQYDQIKVLSKIQENTINLLASNLEELRGNLALTISHELKTPLTGVLGILELLKDGIDEMESTEIHEMLDWASQGASRLERLTSKFLIYLELELASTRQEPWECGQTSFSRKAIEAVLKLEGSNARRSHNLIFAIEEGKIALSERYLEIILQELVDNALKFSPVDSLIKISSRVVGDQLSISIYDSGRGMTEEQISKIDAFMQFERRTYEQQGVGMGLKIVKKIVELAGGEFWINSVYHQETTVNLRLPLVKN